MLLLVVARPLCLRARGAQLDLIVVCLAHICCCRSGNFSIVLKSFFSAMATQSNASAPDSNRKKQTAASDAPHAVQRTNVQLILQYVGPGDWFYMAGVSSLWQQVYRRICEKHAQQQKTWVLKEGKRCYVGPVEATSTYYTKAFASWGRLQLACALGLELGGVKCLQQQAGKCADKQTLLWARTHGLPWAKELTQSLADQGRLRMLQWARLEKQCL
jgi:hypothetical protein